MNDMSIGSMRLPKLGTAGIGEKFARDTVFSLFGKLQIGALTLHEGAHSYHFGTPGRAGEPQAEVHIHSGAVYGLMLRGGSIACGEAYIRGHWASPEPIAVTRLFSANLAVLDGFDDSQSWLVRMALKIAHWRSKNTTDGSRDNISAHYDLGNDFFALFLDSTLMYSSALFTDRQATLEEASVAKLDELCKQLELKPGEHLLEIGTGWGGMAIHAARHYNVKVTTTTISQEQYRHACDRVHEAGLDGQITVLCEDYRKLTGQYDKLVSVEMIEAVGHEFYKSYFETCSNLLASDGKMVIQAITVADQRYEIARDDVDYIKRYIFPGGCLPSIAVISENLALHSDMQMVHLRDITEDYAITLAHWRERFLEQLPKVKAMGFDEDFIRMWEYYLCYCEGGFRERIISTVQLAFAKPGYRFSDQA